MAVIKNRFKDTTEEYLLREFKQHVIEGNSASTFRIRLKCSDPVLRNLYYKFPNLHREYLRAVEQQRKISIHGNRLGPSGLV